MLVMVPHQTGHMEAEDIERYSMGETPDEAAAKFEEHLLVCEACRNRVAESDRLVGAMRSAGRRIRQENSERPQHPRQWLAMLAAAAVIAALVLFGRSRMGARREIPVELTAMRGADLSSHAPAGTPLRLKPDVTGLPAAPAYGLEVVEAAGNRVWHGAFPGGHVPGQPAGTYFVRIYSPGGELLREYGLVLE